MRELPSREAADHKNEALVVLGLTVAFLLVYLRTLCPTVYLGDSGDFCTAIVTGGVPHPPGYPLFGVLGRIALALLPVGEPAYRIGCLVALAAAAAVGVAYLLARELSCSRWASLTGAGLFGASYTFWSQATRVEVYSLHILLSGLLLLAGLRYRRTGRLSWLAAAALAGSLGMAHHLTIALLAPALLVLCGRRLWQDPDRGRRLTLLLALLPIGPSLYFLLLVWARAEPLHAWGHTVNLPLLWSHASARAYRAYLLEMPSCPALLQRLALARGLLSDSFPFMTAVLPLFGAMLLWGRDRAAAISLLLIIGTVTAYNLCYAIDDIAPYYLNAWLAAAVLLAVALEAAQRCLCSPRLTPLAGSLCCLFIGGLLLRNWAACDLSRATWVRDFAFHALEHAEPRGVVVTHMVDDTFPLWYAQDVLGLRPDVVAIDRGSLKFSGIFYNWEPSLWYLYRLRRQGVDISVERARTPTSLAALADDSYLIGLLERQLSGRPAYLLFPVWAPGPGAGKLQLFNWVRRNYQSVPCGLLVRLQPKEQPVDLERLRRQEEQIWAKIRLPDVLRIRTDQEIAPQELIDRYTSMLVVFGNLEEATGHRDRAETIYRQAAAWTPHYRPAEAALTALRRQIATGPMLAAANRH
jgi:hypothetical protein